MPPPYVRPFAATYKSTECSGRASRRGVREGRWGALMRRGRRRLLAYLLSTGCCKRCKSFLYIQIGNCFLLSIYQHFKISLMKLLLSRSYGPFFNIYIEGRIASKVAARAVARARQGIINKRLQRRWPREKEKLCKSKRKRKKCANERFSCFVH